MVTISLPKRIEEKLREKAEEVGAFPEELGIELLFRSLNEELDPRDLIEDYQNLTEKYLAEAKEFFNKGDTVQASEKLWGSAALAVKTIAARRGLKLEKHGSLWSFMDKLSQESGDEDILKFFGEANALHRNFYENEMTPKALGVLSADIEKLITRLKGFS
jgi:hypothetical protein